MSKCRKLRGKYFGAFPVVAVHSPLAIELRLPAWMHSRIHPVFHPMYLRPSPTVSQEPRLRQNLETILNPGEYEVEHIIAHRKGRQGTDYLIQWKNCSYLQATWEPEANLTSAQSAITAYMAKSRKIEVTGIDVLVKG